MATSPQPELAAIREAMARTNGLFNSEVFIKGNLSALDDIYTTDARILPPGAPIISGRVPIKQFWSDLIQAVRAKSAELTSVDLILTGDGVVEIGQAKLEVEPAGQERTTMEAKYVVYWREEEGKWKWHIDIWNFNS